MWKYRRLEARVILVVCVLIYISVFLFSYKQWVVPRYESWGFSYRDIPIGYTLISWVLCLISALWLPRDLTRPSQLLFYIQYLIIFIPASFILYHSAKPEIPPDDVLNLVLSLFSGLTILQVGYKFKLISIERRGLRKRIFWGIFFAVAVCLLVYLLTIFGSYFQLADFEDIYDVRSAASALVEASGSKFSGYAQTWLSGFIFPFLFAFGVFRKRRIFIVIAAAGYFYLLGIGGSKSTMLAMFYLSAIYFLVRSGGKNAVAKMAICLAGLLIFPAILDVAGESGSAIDIWYVAIIHARIFTIPQLSIGQYLNFFADHPLTYGSHITGVNLVVTYPYDMDVPRTVGKYFYDAELTANVNMWAQDGIASFGLIGIPIVSFIAAILFWIFDSIAKLHDPRFVTVALGNIALSFANISLFTTIISGGLFWLTIAIYFLRRERI